MRPLPKRRLEDIIDYIRDEPKTIRQISNELSLPYSSVRRYVFALHLRKLVHIDVWVDNGSRYAAAFLAGEGEDCPKPDRKFMRVRQARKYIQVRPAPVDDDAGDRVRAPAAPAVVDVQRDPLTAALFGQVIRGDNAPPARDALTVALFGDAR